MSEYIEVGQPLQFTDPNTPTRVGEIVENVSDIYNIPSPRLGMQVFVKSEKKSFVITSLKNKVVGGVNVPEAAVEAFEPVGAKSITWNNDTNPSNMNNIVVAGVYDIKGEHKRENDNLPVLNTGGGHSFNARLTVLDSSIERTEGEPQSDDKCITQVMSFNNRLGQGEVYIRTGKGASLNSLSWENWSTLQRNVYVDTVTSLNHLIDNGIYSGVYVKNVAEVETFVMVVINNYAAASQKDMPKSISQFKYSVSLGGSFAKYETRVGTGVNDWGEWEILNKDEITSMISAEIKKVNDRISTLIDDNDPDTLDSIKDLINWVNEHGNTVEGLLAAINANADKINQTIDYASEEFARLKTADNTIKAAALRYDGLTTKTTPTNVAIKATSVDLKNNFTFNIPSATEKEAGVMSAEDKVALDSIPNEIEKIKDGNTIVGQAREIHSRNGKTVPDRFLARTTAGSGTIGDGVASLKSVGGNIVKNIVDGTFESGWYGIQKLSGCVASRKIEDSYDGFFSSKFTVVSGHKYLYTTLVLARPESRFLMKVVGIKEEASQKDLKAIYTKKTDIQWMLLSCIHTATTDYPRLRMEVLSESGSTNLSIAKPVVINLTEMFGAGNEPDQATCDRLFGTMDALPQGLSIAKPTEFKSIGFNQFNPDNVLEGKAIVDNAIVSGDNKIAVIPCLPCKVGTGENNGYCIHGDFGDDIKVYLTPLNPMEVDGELYMHELTKDATTDTYVPLIKGYMLVEVPTTANLCAHFLWSEDKCKRDTYEPYFESKVELPVIPEMSEWGLAGIQSSGTLVADTIDLDRMVYTKRVGCVDMGSLNYSYIEANNVFNLEPYTNKGLNFKGGGAILASAYTTASAGYADSARPDKTIYAAYNKILRIYINDSSYTDAESFKASLQGVMLYYELATPEKYPLPKVDNNYISSDYGVELFDSVVPCNANNLYYMRSLAGETRNFLDRLMAGLGTSDATVVADRILAVVNPAVPANVEPETPIEE